MCDQQYDGIRDKYVKNILTIIYNHKPILQGYSFVHNNTIFYISITRINDEEVMKKYNIRLKISNNEAKVNTTFLWRNLIEVIPRKIKEIYKQPWLKWLKQLGKILENYNPHTILTLRKVTKYMYLGSQKIDVDNYAKTSLLVHKEIGSETITVEIKHVVKAPLNAVFAQTPLTVTLDAKTGVLMDLGVNPVALNFTVKYMFSLQKIEDLVSKIIQNYMNRQGIKHYHIMSISIKRAWEKAFKLYPSHEEIIVYPVLDLIAKVVANNANYSYKVYLNMMTNQSIVEPLNTTSTTNISSPMTKYIISLIILIGSLIMIYIYMRRHK
ncbi:MAG: hypothetical protein GXO43_05320 [Crenarchaeota archaeon]|nr:hypothetical protein [Thermoproteota archaeon]